MISLISSRQWVAFIPPRNRNHTQTPLLVCLISLYTLASVGRRVSTHERTVAFLHFAMSGFSSSLMIIPLSTSPSTVASVHSPKWRICYSVFRRSVVFLSPSPKRHRRLRGVMIGRMAMQNPWLLRHVDELFYNSPGPHLSRRQVIERYVDYVEQMEKKHRTSLLAVWS